MNSFTVKVCGLVLLVSVFCVAQQRYPYSSSRVNAQASPLGDSQSLSSPGSTSQQTARHPSSTTPVRNLPAGLNMPVGQSPLTTSMTAAPVELGAGDLLDINVLDTPEVSGHFRVNSAGEITMPLIGVVPVKDLSPEQAQGLIANKLVLGNFIKDPQVTVFVSEYASQMVYVLGEVKNPGAYPLMGSHRVLDFVSAAGGLTQIAANVAKLTRSDDPTHPLTLPLNSGNAADNCVLHPGDIISIEKSGIVYVLGDVNRPGGFIVDRNEHLTVLRALALAEGTAPYASLHHAKLIRTVNGLIATDLDLKKLFKGEALDPVLQEGDIVFVSSGRIFKRSFDAILQGATTAAVYASRP